MTSSRITLCVHLCSSVVLFSLAGCGFGKTTYPVEGVVVFEDGAPAKELAGGLVSFESSADQSNSSGEIQPDGAFKLVTPRGTFGAYAGEHRVLVMPPEPRDPDNPPPSVVGQRFRRYETSGIKITVAEGPNRVSVKVSRFD